jgi:broad specificity phosphatase PhoE
LSIEIIYETHSLSVDNERGFATGWLDGELSARGRELARELGERRRDDGIAAVFASDLGRAVETAEIAFGDSGIPIHRDWRLRECNYGELNGQPLACFEGEPPRHINEPYPGGESYRQVVDRVEAFLEDLPADLEGSRILVIGHAATVRVARRLDLCPLALIGPRSLERRMPGVPQSDLLHECCSSVTRSTPRRSKTERSRRSENVRRERSQGRSS